MCGVFMGQRIKQTKPTKPRVQLISAKNLYDNICAQISFKNVNPKNSQNSCIAYFNPPRKEFVKEND